MTRATTTARKIVLALILSIGAACNAFATCALDSTATSGWTLVTDTTSDYSLVGDKPSALAQDEYLLAFFHIRAGGSTATVTFTPEAGFTEIHSNAAPGAVRPLFWIGYKKATGSEPSTYTFAATVTAGTTTHAQLILDRVTGADATTFIDVASSVTGGSSVSPASPARTTTTTNACVVSMIAGNSGSTFNGDDANYPSGMTIVASRISTSSSSGVQGGIAWVLQAAAGDSGTKTWTSVYSGSTGYQAIGFGIKSSAGASTVVNPISGGGGTAARPVTFNLREPAANDEQFLLRASR
jgi:hypothetical protein